ncbi:MAG: hypothetical protein F9K22_12785 [Bacteroidetes bacterium]|nr:MAG: hypothetical protein F9K22_12785 [Bacteroidota bacterium]
MNLRTGRTAIMPRNAGTRGQSRKKMKGLQGDNGRGSPQFFHEPAPVIQFLFDHAPFPVVEVPPAVAGAVERLPSFHHGTERIIVRLPFGARTDGTPFEREASGRMVHPHPRGVDHRCQRAVRMEGAAGHPPRRIVRRPFDDEIGGDGTVLSVEHGTVAVRLPFPHADHRIVPCVGGEHLAELPSVRAPFEPVRFASFRERDRLPDPVLPCPFDRSVLRRPLPASQHQQHKEHRRPPNRSVHRPSRSCALRPVPASSQDAKLAGESPHYRLILAPFLSIFSNSEATLPTITDERRPAMKRILIVVLMLLTALSADAQLKKRVAVSRFENRSGSGYHHLGEGVADMLVTALVKSNKFSPLERQELEKVLAEQKLGESGLVTAETAPKIGKLLGVELLVVGSISEFGQKEKKVSGGISFLSGGIKTKTSRAVVDVRLVNTVTGEIVAAETCEGEESSTGIAVDYEDIDFSNMDSWDDTDIGKATREAVDGVVELIVKNMASIPWAGKVLKVNADGTILIKPGSEGNVKPGMEFEIYRLGEAVKDPDTGLDLGAEEERVAKIKVIEDALKGKAAKAKVVEGSGIQTNDIVREPK